MSIRPVKQILESTPTVEGAGVKLRRAFGFGSTEELDPFLLSGDIQWMTAGRPSPGTARS